MATKEPINLIVSVGSDGLQCQKLGLSVGEARLAFDQMCQRPMPQWKELLLLERLKAAKRRQFAGFGVPLPIAPIQPAQVPVPEPVMKKLARLPKIIRRGR
jgi:hypothetical protein